MRAVRYLVLSIMVMANSAGCANFGKQLKAFVGGGPSETAEVKTARPKARFSETQNLDPKNSQRRYRRMTKDLFEQEGMLQEKAGSLWVMEGQGSYLFSQNISRLVGDLINVELEGAPRSQLETKISVIRKLMEKSKKPQIRAVASTPAATGQGGQDPAKPQEAGQNKPDDKNQPQAQQNAQAQAVTQAPVQQVEEKEDIEQHSFDVQTVPSRIVEREPDGSYRIKGSQSFMIGKKEYRVIVTGLIRGGDISTDSVPASKILDAKFDVVGNKKETR